MDEGIISGLFLGFAVLIPLEVCVRTMEICIIPQPRRLGPLAHRLRDIIVLTWLVQNNNVVPGRDSYQRPRQPRGPAIVQRSSLYHDSRDLSSVKTVTLRLISSS